jgi:hypothetical protein
MCHLSMRETHFFINAIKKACKKHMLLKQHVILTYQGTHVNLICEFYEISRFVKNLCP